MQIQIASKGIDVSQALEERITDRLEEMMDKYIHREGEAQVTISREGSGFRTICSVHLVIAESTRKIRTLTPGMAALELGLADSGVVVFHNARHGGINVVFKRADGNIGWIDPKTG